MKKFIKVSAFLLAFAFVLGLFQPLPARAATTPSLGAATTYGVLSSTYTDTSGATTVNGDVGFTTPPATPPAGVHTNYGSGFPYSAAGTDQGIARTALASQPCTFTFAPGAINLSTDVTHGAATVYTPGVYCSTGAMSIGGPLLLTGGGTYIFRPVGALTSVVGATTTLAGGASSCDVFWTPTQATTLAANTLFVGTVIDDADITTGINTIWNGRALAFGGVVTTAASTITVPSCATSPATLHVVKLVVNTSGGTAVASAFNIHVMSSGVEVAGSPATGVSAPGTSYSLAAGTYVVSEDANPFYVRTFTGACNASGSVTLFTGNDVTCTVVNTDIAPSTVTTGGGGGGGGNPTVATVVPLIGILKVPTPLSLPSSGPVTYNYTVRNVGGQIGLASVTVTDDRCSPITFLDGDLNSDGILDITESWRYSCSMTVPATMTNTAVASAFSNDASRQPTVATAVATVSVGGPTPPLINIIKVPSRLTPFPIGGGNVTYTYSVTNPGIVALSNVVVTDDKCGPVLRTAGDTNLNSLLEPSEVWTYSCAAFVPISTRNIATAEGRANGFVALAYAFADVFVSPLSLPSAGLHDDGPGPILDMVLLSGLLLIVGLSVGAAAKKKNLV